MEGIPWYECVALAQTLDMYLKFCLRSFFFLPNIIELQNFVVTLRMATLYKILIMCVVFALSNDHLWAQKTLTDDERQAKLDSIIAETERRFGWNDDAYSAKIAKDKWQSCEAKLLLQGGIAPVIYVGQEQFVQKYGVDYDDFGCMAYCSEAQMAKYNTVIMDYLTVNFGNEWCDYVRKDVPGFDKYGVEAFRNIKYGENGEATVVLPVIYKSLGKYAGQGDQDAIVINKLIGCDPSTSLEFLHRGIEYYIPLSCDINVETIPLENELIEITIRVFNPKVFRYSKKTKPYPYCIIESIDLLR